MTQQIPLQRADRADETDRDDGTHEIAPDLAYIRTIMVNVIFVGLPNAGDRNWVLVDAGVISEPHQALGFKARAEGAI